MICSNCGSQGDPKRCTPGSLFIELILWLCFVIPGLIYTIWRVCARHDVCRKCGSRALIPTDSPMGLKLLRDTEQTLPPPLRPSPPSRAAVAIGRLFWSD